MKFPDYFIKTFSFDVGKWNVSPTYWQAGAIVFLLFLLVLTFARLRRMYVHWSMKGFIPTLLLGFFLAIIIEGLLIVSGKTLITQIVGWENAPKPVSTALDEGRYQLVKVLGEQNYNFLPQKLTPLEIVDYYSKLPESDVDSVKELICEPGEVE